MMKPQLVLSLFPGIGLLDYAFEMEGFAVVRGPDYLWGGDVRKFSVPSGRFDGVIGGPPCQAFSRLVHIVRANGHEPMFGNLIPEFERIVCEALPRWFLMENVPDAPMPFESKDRLPAIDYGFQSFLLNNRQCFDDDGNPAEQNRVRRWTFGYRGSRRLLAIETAALANPRFRYAATSAGDRQVPVAIGESGKPKRNKIGRLVSRDVLSNGTNRTAAGFESVKELQGLPPEFDIPPFTVAAKVKAVANGVPLPMGRALAKAVRDVTDEG